jgi:hypothetical protein
MTKTALEKISIHEAECAERYIAIEKRLESGSKQFDKFEKMLWGIYPFRFNFICSISIWRLV